MYAWPVVRVRIVDRKKQNEKYGYQQDHREQQRETN